MGPALRGARGGVAGSMGCGGGDVEEEEEEEEEEEGLSAHALRLS